MFKTKRDQIEFYYREGLEDHQAQLHSPGNLYFTMLRRHINSHLWRHVHTHGRDGLLADIGCAEGLYLRHWAADFELKVGLDLSFPKVCRGSGRSSGFPRVCFLVGDLEALPFGAESFDAVICSEVLEHVPNVSVALQNLYTVLRPGGVLVGSVPTDQNKFFASKDGPEHTWTEAGHLHRFSKSQISMLLNEHGFAVENATTVDLLGQVREPITRWLMDTKRRLLPRRSRNPSKTGTDDYGTGGNAAAPQLSLASRLYLETWYVVDSLLSRLPLLRRWGCYAVFVARRAG